MQYSSGKSALVFCSTRKGAQEAAQVLAQTAMTHGYSNPFIKSSEQLEKLREASLLCGGTNRCNLTYFMVVSANFVYYSRVTQRAYEMVKYLF